MSLFNFLKRRAKRPFGPMPGDTVLLPGFGLMDNDFEERVHAVRPGRFHVQMGVLTGWWSSMDFRLLPDGRWAHKDIAEEYA